jgi:hypothetical protein
MQGLIRLIIYILIFALLAALHMRVRDINDKLDAGRNNYTRTAINN